LRPPRPARLPLSFASEIVQLEAQVLRETDESATVFFYPQQRVDADGVGRDEIAELEPRRRSRARACLEQCSDLRLGEASRKPNDHAVVLVVHLNPTLHDGSIARSDPPIMKAIT
jgi:hypothetical protein